MATLLRWGALLLAVLVLPARAHLVAGGQGAVRLVDDAAYVLVSVPVAALAGFDDNHDGRIDRAEIDAHRAQLDLEVSALLVFTVDGRPGELVFGDLLLPNEDGAPSPDLAVMRRYRWPVPVRTLAVQARLFHAGGTRARTLALRVIRGADTEVALLSADRPAHTYFAGPLATFRNFALAGIDHILGGPDHLMFLLTILVTGAAWRYWVGVITSFTLAHSITLACTAFGVLAVPPAVVEPLIAASIVLMAVDNLVRGERAARHRVWLVFACGLLHGMGIASAFAELGLPGELRVLGVVSFNLGVEAGQLFFVGAVLALFALVRRVAGLRWHGYAVRAASVMAAVAGGWWLVERTFALA